MIDFFGKTVTVLYGAMGNMLLALIAYLVLVLVLMFKLLQNVNNNIILGEYLLPKILDAEKKAKNETERASKRLTLSGKYGYMAPATMLCSLSETVFGSLFAIGFLSKSVIDLNQSIIGINLSISPKDFLLNHDKTYIKVIVLLAVAAVLQLIHDNIVQRHLLFDEAVASNLILIGMFAVAALLPSIFAVYWLLFELIELCEMVIVTTFQKKKRLQRLIGNAKEK